MNFSLLRSSSLMSFSSLRSRVSPRLCFVGPRRYFSLEDRHINPPALSTPAWSKDYVSQSTATELPTGGVVSNPHPSCISLPYHIYNVDLKTAYAKLAELKQTKKDGFGLSQRFYTDPDIYQLDLLNVWKKNWLFAGYEIQIPKAGDYFTIDIANDSLIIIRNDDGSISALYNSCRHRGSRICPSDSSSETKHTKRLVCPYHQWSYDRGGRLQFARDMPANFNKADYGLRKAHVELLDGFIFIHLSTENEGVDHSFEDARQWISPHIKHHGLKDAKIIHTDLHIINANWKLVYENNRECYHCPGGHPEYIMSNYDLSFSYIKNESGEIVRTVDPDHPNKADIEAHIAQKTAYWKSMGLNCTPDNAFPGPGWYRASRQPLRKGWLNESTEGKLVCKKRMGTLPSDDMGSLRIHTLPNFWIHASSDHAASARLTPMNAHQTFARIDWMVHKDAVEGRDYDIEKLIAFWKITNAQDWKLCEVNQLGVMSSVYQPGRLSEKKELGLERFLNWYLKEVSEPSISSKKLSK